MLFEITIDEVGHAGYAVPLATLRTAIWTGLQGSADAYFDCFTPELKEAFQKARASAAERARCGTTSPGCSCGSGREQLRCTRVYVQHVVSDNENELEYELETSDGANRRCKQPFRRVGEAWKISGPPQEIR